MRNPVLACLLLAATAQAQEVPPRPNVILIMADDLGYGDVGFLGLPGADTPELDALAASGVVLPRFYAAAPVCSPTRASFLTGRHPSRMGISGANRGHLPHAEVTLAECLRDAGYATGFFGKWHLGTLTRRLRDSNRGGLLEHLAHYSPPQEHGFQEVFATEAKVPTYDPMRHPETGEPYGTRYWDRAGQVVKDNLAGDDSARIMDRVLPFVERSRSAGDPFLAVVWFHTPHLPVVASPQAQEHYAQLKPGAQAYRGSIRDMDQQVGRLVAFLEEQGVAQDTLIAFCSDNGPEGSRASDTNGKTGGLRGRKRSLFEGGVRVPAFVTWPRGLPGGESCELPASTSDWLATVLEACGESGRLPARPMDGSGLLGALRGEAAGARAPIGFHYSGQSALVDGATKWIQQGEQAALLFDLDQDPAEQQDLAADEPARAKALAEAFAAWQESCAVSASGQDYGSCEAVIGVSRPTANQPAAGWTDGTDWLDQHQQCRELQVSGGVRLALLGDSITQSFGGPGRSIWAPGQAAFDRFLAPRGAANYGLSGDRTQHVLWRLQHGALDGRDPEWVVLNVGTNNLASDSPEDIAAGIEAVLNELERVVPRAKVLLLGLFPRGEASDHPDRQRVRAVNALLPALAAERPRVRFEDLGGCLLLADARANPELMAADFVHLTPAGYGAWGAALAERIPAAR